MTEREKMFVKTIFRNQNKLTGMVESLMVQLMDMVQCTEDMAYVMLQTAEGEDEPKEDELPKPEPKLAQIKNEAVAVPEIVFDGTVQDVDDANDIETVTTKAKAPEKPKKTAICNMCGKEYVKTSNSQKYCPDCKEKHIACLRKKLSLRHIEGNSPKPNRLKTLPLR